MRYSQDTKALFKHGFITKCGETVKPMSLYQGIGSVLKRSLG